MLAKKNDTRSVYILNMKAISLKSDETVTKTCDITALINSTANNRSTDETLWNSE